MEFAHINAILRSAHFPPYDPWFSGGYINYYYYGSYLIAFLFKLTGIPSEIAFNLAQPTVIAMLASAAYSITSALSRGLIGRRAARIGGLIGAMFMVVAGNLDSAVRFMRGLPEPATPDFFGWTWAASRAITGGITEFPYFTGLYADLHAHVIAWPMTLLVIALCYSLAQQPRQFAVALSRSTRRRSAAFPVASRLLFIAVVLGTLFATNAWDVPVYAALVATSIFMATVTCVICYSDVGNGTRDAGRWVRRIHPIPAIPSALCHFVWLTRRDAYANRPCTIRNPSRDLHGCDCRWLGGALPAVGIGCELDCLRRSHRSRYADRASDRCGVCRRDFQRSRRGYDRRSSSRRFRCCDLQRVRYISRTGSHALARPRCLRHARGSRRAVGR